MQQGLIIWTKQMLVGNNKKALFSYETKAFKKL